MRPQFGICIWRPWLTTRNARQVLLPTAHKLISPSTVKLVFLYKLVEGVAESSFGTHVAKLAGVPQEVVQRADVVSESFARQFKERIEGRKRKATSAALPLVTLADFAYLTALATGKVALPDNPVRRREVLVGLKATMRSCLKF